MFFTPKDCAAEQALIPRQRVARPGYALGPYRPVRYGPWLRRAGRPRAEGSAHPACVTWGHRQRWFNQGGASLPRAPLPGTSRHHNRTRGPSALPCRPSFAGSSRRTTRPRRAASASRPAIARHPHALWSEPAAVECLDCGCRRGIAAPGSPMAKIMGQVGADHDQRLVSRPTGAPAPPPPLRPQPRRRPAAPP